MVDDRRLVVDDRRLPVARSYRDEDRLFQDRLPLERAPVASYPDYDRRPPRDAYERRAPPPSRRYEELPPRGYEAPPPRRDERDRGYDDRPRYEPAGY